jgi:hypothetical protein
MSKFFVYNTKTKKKYVFEDDSLFGEKFQRHVNKSNDELLYTTSEIELDLLKLSHNLSMIKK